MARTLLIFRHAKSGHEAGRVDFDRTLTERGQKDARRMGELARNEKLVPELVLCSSAARARETLQYFALGAEFGGRVEYLRELYLAEPDACLEALAQHGGDSASVMLIGHNPGLEELLTELTGERRELTTAALVECTVDATAWSALASGARATLVRSFRPKDSG